MAAAVVHKEDEIIIRLNDSASVLDAEMTAIRVALENASKTRDNISIHTDSLTAVNILNNRKLDLNTITRAIRDAASILTQRPTINWNCLPGAVLYCHLHKIPAKPTVERISSYYRQTISLSQCTSQTIGKAKFEETMMKSQSH